MQNVSLLVTRSRILTITIHPDLASAFTTAAALVKALDQPSEHRGKETILGPKRFAFNFAIS